MYTFRFGFPGKVPTSSCLKVATATISKRKVGIVLNSNHGHCFILAHDLYPCRTENESVLKLGSVMPSNKSTPNYPNYIILIQTISKLYYTNLSSEIF